MTVWRRLFDAQDLEALRVVAEGRARPEVCQLCKDVPSPHVLVERGHDAPSAFRAHLAGEASLKRCPISGAAYFQSSRYEYLAGGSEDEYTFGRVTPERASEMLAEWAAEEPPGGKPRA